MRRHVIFLLIAALCSIMISAILILLTEGKMPILTIFRPKSIVIVYLSGRISYESPGLPIFGQWITPSLVKKLLERGLRENPGAIILVINSPGGEASACYEIYRIILKFKEENNVTIVSYIPSVACSGGYYITLASDLIVSSPNAIVGSVGAMGTLFSYAELLRRLGVEVRIVKSGEYKDLGNPLKEISEVDISVIERLVTKIHEHFIEILLKEREDKLNERNITDVINAMIYLGKEAKEVGLVDHIGSLCDAIEEARKLAGLPREAPVIEIRPEAQKLFPLLFGEGIFWFLKILYELLKLPITDIRLLYG